MDIFGKRDAACWQGAATCGCGFDGYGSLLLRPRSRAHPPHPPLTLCSGPWTGRVLRQPPSVTRRVTEAQGDPGPWEMRPPEDRCPPRTSSPLRMDAEPVELPDDTHRGRFPLGKALLAPTSTGQIWGSVRTSKISESLGLCLSPSFSFEPQREGGFSRDGGSRGTDSLMTN